MLDFYQGKFVEGTHTSINLFKSQNITLESNLTLLQEKSSIFDATMTTKFSSTSFIRSHYRSMNMKYLTA